jgi:hypothetical protein
MRGVSRLATGRRWFRTMAVDVCLLFSFVVIFFSTYFRFPFVEPSQKAIGLKKIILLIILII